MSSKGFQRPWINGFGAKIVTFRLKPNGASDPTIDDNPDNVVTSVSRSGAGVWLVTLSDTFLELRSWSCGVQLNAAVATTVCLTGAETVSTTKTLTFTVMQESAGTFAAADIAANANNLLTFTLVLRDSGQ